MIEKEYEKPATKHVWVFQLFAPYPPTVRLQVILITICGLKGYGDYNEQKICNG